MFRLILHIFSCCMLIVTALFARQSNQPDKTRKHVSEPLVKSAGTPVYGVLNINNIRAWARADGQSNHSPSGDNGLYYPYPHFQGGGNLVYSDGIVWGAKAFLDQALTQPAPNQVIRVGGGTYGAGTKTGWVSGFGATASPEPLSSTANRIYRIRRDYLRPKYRSIEFDAADVYEIPTSSVTSAQISAVIAQYEKDWDEWPVQRGAPYIERNGVPGYQAPPKFLLSVDPDSLISGYYDEPGLAGADSDFPAGQVIWTAYNDLDSIQTRGFAGSLPLGLEVQKTIWAYPLWGPLYNLYFNRYRIINKGGVDLGNGNKGAFYLDSVHVCQFSDPDLGSFSDDLGGCDTILDLDFSYNANAIDQVFNSLMLPPPSIGYSLLQGPSISSPGDSAIMGFERRPGYKNIRMSSAAAWGAGDPYSHPPYGSDNYATGSGRWWKIVRGYAPLGDMSTPPFPYASPPGANPRYMHSGDPVARTGSLDGLGTGYSVPPGDRQILFTTGPFHMAPGDTQEIIIAVAAGLGADHLSSVSVMKYYTRFARRVQRGLFNAPRGPAPPRVKAVELDKEIILEWGSELSRVRETEETVIANEYAFEGYSVYQLPNSSSSLSDGVKIATYDRVNGITVVVEDQFDSQTGLLIPVVVQKGTDSGIRRFLKIARNFLDAAAGTTGLKNGQEYYFAVTAYNYTASSDAVPKSFESTPEIIRVKPRIPFGLSTSIVFGDTLQASHVSGRSDGSVVPLVVNPLTGTGHSYEVRFDTTAGIATWSLRNITKDSLLLTGQTDQASGDDSHQVEGGILLKVSGPKPGMKTWQAPSGTRRFSSFGGEYFFTPGYSDPMILAITWDDPAHFFGSTTRRGTTADRLRTVLLSLAVAASKTTGTIGNGLNPYGGWDESATTDPNMSYGYRYLRNASLAPARPEFSPYVVNPSTGYAFQDYKKGVPLSAWDIETNPPTRLAVGFLENNVAGGLVDGKWWPPNASLQANINPGDPREWLFIFDKPYSASIPDTSLQQSINITPLPVMWWLTVTRRSGNDFNTSTPSGTDQFLIVANHANFVGDVFTYASPAPQSGPEVQKQSAQRVGVFPNPYYGSRSQETTTWRRFVTFNNLPPRAKIYIFNLAGHLVRTLDKDDTSQFLEWDLTNRNNWQVASGIYICYVEMPDIGETKILKLSVIQSELPAR